MFHCVSFIYFLSFSFPLKLLKMGLGFDLDAHLLKHILFLFVSIMSSAFYISYI